MGDRATGEVQAVVGEGGGVQTMGEVKAMVWGVQAMRAGVGLGGLDDGGSVRATKGVNFLRLTLFTT